MASNDPDEWAEHDAAEREDQEQQQAEERAAGRHVIIYVRANPSWHERQQRACVEYLTKIGLVADRIVFDNNTPEPRDKPRTCIRDILQRCEEPCEPDHLVVLPSPDALGATWGECRVHYVALCDVAEVHFATCTDYQDSYGARYIDALGALEAFAEYEPRAERAITALRRLDAPSPPSDEEDGENQPNWSNYS